MNAQLNSLWAACCTENEDEENIRLKWMPYSIKSKDYNKFETIAHNTGYVSADETIISWCIDDYDRRVSNIITLTEDKSKLVLRKNEEK